MIVGSIPPRVLPSGVAIMVDPGAPGRIVCDRCGLGMTLGPEVRILRPSEGAWRSKEDYSYAEIVTEPGPIHLCRQCFGRVQGAIEDWEPPSVGTIWWSQIAPRHVVEIRRYGDMEVQAWVLWSPELIGDPTKAPPLIRVVDARFWHLLYADPKDLVSDDDLCRGRVWVSTDDNGQKVVIDHIEPNEDAVFQEPNEHGHTRVELGYLYDNYFPMPTVMRRTWHQRILVGGVIGVGEEDA